MATLCSDVDFSQWAIDPPARGGRLGLVRSTAARTLPIFQLTRLPVLRTPFGAGSYGDEVQTRLSLVITDLPQDVISFFTRLDNHFINVVADRSQELLKKQHTVEQIADMWKPALASKSGYPFQFKAKYNTEGKRAVKIWDTSGHEMPIAPVDLIAHPLTAVVKATGFWVMSGREMGVVYDIQHILVGEPIVECPFPIQEQLEDDGASTRE